MAAIQNTRPVVAIMYDFDKTLSTKDMQEYTFIPSLGIKKASDFWKHANTLAVEQKMDSVLAYMYVMLQKSAEKQKPIRRKELVRQGRDIEFFPGVLDWFKRINAYGDKAGIMVEHYIISSGLKEIIDGTAIAKAFKQIYASEFLYDEQDIAIWPKLAINYTAKTQFPYRINKGVLDVSEDRALNEHTPEGERHVPFRNMIYIGDGLTDVPCMKLVKTSGGRAIGVYPPSRRGQAEELLRYDRVNYIAPADYSKGQELEKIVKDILANMKSNDDLVTKTYLQKKKLGLAEE